ncbi:hypothetical protein [Fischerella thermalis]|uniref:hypothetical protein n=4 Tax=Fischerella thermalis TaxID=372787 RepID=UPI0002EAA5C8|nr:hypothetical protein [Fischerella thermalis]PLZ07629.1 hypothetical protein CBP18_16505 [Fischerella thermalis WC119]PLZ13009.1 hypothetical protein CBP19_10670 [Fischerella thermalis WC1110]PLZ18019.1 hypothetical protein CBP29_20580 [Fischerella thermalis WC341]PLZ33232.1 hypothetical protein CBP10_08195 [Fischerella thermalis WC558]PLZ41656.1 hypothetical protein CBP25_16385 [Fischerella thermalis WC527]
MKRVLVVYYSQSGDVTRAVESFTKFLQTAEIELTWECIKPKDNYPFPWSLYKFFDVFPECVNGEPPEIYPPKFGNDEKFDLIILAYQVWFLAPSLPIQGFLKSKYAKVLENTKVITLVVCRNMWHSASETMKKMIAEVGGIHIDNVVLTHQGPPLATFITTPRLLLTGKKNRFLGVLPAAGVRDEDIYALSRFGKRIANNLAALSDSSRQPMLQGLGAVEVNQRYVIPEFIGRLVYRPWAKIARFFGKQGSWSRIPIVCIFAVQLIFAIPIVLIVSTVVQLLFAPLIHKKIASYVELLKSPSGVD